MSNVSLKSSENELLDHVPIQHIVIFVALNKASNYFVRHPVERIENTIEV